MALEAEDWVPIPSEPDDLGGILGGSPTPGVWGTDITIDTGVFYNSDASVKLSSTSNRAGIYLRDQVPVGDAAAFSVWAALKDDGSSGSDGVYLGIVEYDEAGEMAQEQHVTLVDNVDLAATFQLFEQTFNLDGSTAFVRPYVLKYSSQAINIWIGLLDAQPLSAGFSAGVGADVSYATGANKVAFDTEDFDHGAVFDAATNYRYTARVGGRKSVNVYAFLYTAAAPSAPMTVRLSLKLNGATIREAIYGSDTTAIAAGGPYVWLDTYSEVHLLDINDYLEVFIVHTNAANVFVETRSRFSVISLD